jgi:hypothetical protein
MIERSGHIAGDATNTEARGIKGEKRRERREMMTFTEGGSSGYDA